MTEEMESSDNYEVDFFAGYEDILDNSEYVTCDCNI